MLRSKFFPGRQVKRIVADYRDAGLPEEDVALLAFAEKVVGDAWRISSGDVEELRRRGFSDEEILDVAMTVGARSFFSKVLDATGAEPDGLYDHLEKGLRQAMAVGRPLEQKLQILPKHMKHRKTTRRRPKSA